MLEKKIFCFCLSILFTFFLNAQEEKTTHYFGAIFTEGENAKEMNFTVNRSSSYPASFSLKNRITSYGNQGTRGTCVGWASTYNILQILNFNSAVNYQNLYSPQLTYDLIKPSIDLSCNIGTANSSALAVLKNIGAIDYTKYPDFCQDFNPNAKGLARIYTDDKENYLNLRINAKENKISDYFSLGNKYFKAKVKHLLSQNTPVLVGIDFHKSMENSTYIWNGNKDGAATGHSMCIIGYNDTLHGGAFQLLNSWGEDWANNGSFWVKYEDLKGVLKEAYGIEKIEQNSFQYDEIELEKFKFSIHINTELKFKVDKVNNENIIFKKYDFYVPILHNNEEIEYDIRYKGNSDNTILILTSNQNGYVYVLAKENSEIKLVYPILGEDKNQVNADKNLKLPLSTFIAKSYDQIEKNPSKSRRGSLNVMILFSPEEIKMDEILLKTKGDNLKLREFAFEYFGPKLNYLDTELNVNKDKSINVMLEDISNTITPVNFKIKL